TTLTLSDNPITALTGVNELPKLINLKLSNNQLTDLSQLLELTQLETLNLDNSQNLSCAQLNEFKTQTSAVVSAQCGNLPPVIDASEPHHVNEQTRVSLSIEASDSDGFMSSYQVIQTAGPSVYIPRNGKWISFQAPVTTQQHTLSFKVTATDNNGAIATDTVDVIVNPVNLAPVTNAGVDQFANGQERVILSGSGSDEDGSIKSYHWSQTAGDTVILNNSDFANARFVTPVLTNTGVLSFTLTVTDNENTVHTDEVSVTVSPLNLLINANAGVDQTVNEATEVTLSAANSTADNPITDYQWTQLGGSTVVINNANEAIATFTAPVVTQLEILTLQVLITDDQGNSAGDLVEISISPVNVAPIVNAGMDKNANGFAQVTLTGLSEGDDIISAIQWTQTGGDTVRLSNANSLTATFTAPGVTAPTTLTFTLTLTDDEGAPASDEVQITVLPDAMIAGIVFDDADLGTCVREAALANDWLIASQMTMLDCTNKSISDLGGIEYLTALTTLNLSNNLIKYFWKLRKSNYSALTHLDLSHNFIESDFGLGDLKMAALNSLSLNNNKISELSTILSARFPDLTTFNLQDNPLADISRLQWITTLTSLNISNTLVTNIVPLFTLPAITTLDLSGNTGITCQLLTLAAENLSNTNITRPQSCFTNEALISAITFIDSAFATCVTTVAQNEGWTTIEQMRTLTCESAGVVDMSGLELLSALTELHVKGNSITNLNPIIYLNHLSVLDLSDNNVTDLLPLALMSPLIKTIDLSNNLFNDA
ncbi:MAG: hypothetical protein MJK04_09380, partial [Psychrosphaera sp.]|nr:hypothetical protein [Psychrosphaera sp.]